MFHVHQKAWINYCVKRMLLHSIPPRLVGSIQREESFAKQNIMKIKCIHDIKRYQNIYFYSFFPQNHSIASSLFCLPLSRLFLFYDKSSFHQHFIREKEIRKNPSWCFSFSSSEKCYNFFALFSFRCHRFNRNWTEKNVFCWFLFSPFRPYMKGLKVRSLNTRTTIITS